MKARFSEKSDDGKWIHVGDLTPTELKEQEERVIKNKIESLWVLVPDNAEQPNK